MRRSESVKYGEAPGLGNLLAQRLHKCFATAAKKAFAGLLPVQEATRKFLETKESESRLRDGYRALLNSRWSATFRLRMIQLRTGSEQTGGWRERKWLRTIT